MTFTSTLNSLIGRHKLLIVVSRLISILSNNLSKIFVAVESSCVTLTIESNELIIRHLLCVL